MQRREKVKKILKMIHFINILFVYKKRSFFLSSFIKLFLKLVVTYILQHGT